MRINQFLAKCGLGSRRSVEKLIEDGNISLNGKCLSDKSYKVDLENDEITYLGKKCSLEKASASTWVFHKPPGYLCTRSDPNRRKTIFDLLPHLEAPFQAVGRLDKDSRGLLLISKDGELSEKLMHPRYSVSKTYKVLVEGKWKESFKELLTQGVQMKEGGSGVMSVLSVKERRLHLYECVVLLHEGKKREIRYSFEALHLKVLDLCRTHIGKFSLGDLKEGHSREITKEDEALLFE